VRAYRGKGTLRYMVICAALKVSVIYAHSEERRTYIENLVSVHYILICAALKVSVIYAHSEERAHSIQRMTNIALSLREKSTEQGCAAIFGSKRI
jgi:hypothetical protein